MIVRNFLIADAVTHSPDGKAFIHGGGIGKLFAATFPWTLPQIAVFVTLLPEEGDEPGPDHDLTVDFETPAGEVLNARISGSFHIPPPTNPEIAPPINFTSQFVGAQFPEPGVYWVRVLYDGIELARSALEVEQGRQEWVQLGGPPPPTG